MPHKIVRHYNFRICSFFGTLEFTEFLVPEALNERGINLLICLGFLYILTETEGDLVHHAMVQRVQGEQRIPFKERGWIWTN